MYFRLFLSVVVGAIWLGLEEVWVNIVPQVQGVASAAALNNDSIVQTGILQWVQTHDPFSVIGILLLVAVLLIIWAGPLLKWNGIMLMVIGLLLAALFLSGCDTSRATSQSEQYGTPDIVEIKPNQTAFQIPVTGANLAGQQKLNSIQYLEQQKVPAKRATIQKQNQGGKWVPDTYVYLVNRTQVVQQWTSSSSTGSSSKNESVCGESNESIQVCFQLNVGAEVTEDQASTYLYHYQASASPDPQVAGVYEAEPSQTVNTVVRQYIQKTIAEEEATRSLDQIILDKATMVQQAQDQAIKYFGPLGLTIDYVGLGGELVLDPAIQTVINGRFVANQNVAIAHVNATTTAVVADAAAYSASKRASGDATAIAVLDQSVGNNPQALAQVLEEYKWNGSRVTVELGSGNQAAVVIPANTPVPTSLPTPKPAPAQTTPAATPSN